MKVKRSKKSQDKLAVAMIIGTLVFFGGLLLLKTHLAKRKPLDELTLCPPEGETARSAVLIDKSDAWGNDDINRIKTFLASIYGGIPGQSRLTIYGIVGKARETTEVKRFFDICNPGSEDECNALYQNCGRMKKRYQNAFWGPLRELAEELKVPGQSSFSPLLETVSQIVDENGEVPLVLYIVSDMMENHYKFRFYDVVPLADEMIGEYPLSNTEDISVEARYIQRSRHSKELVHAVLNVWREYFEQQGVKITLSRLFVAD